MTEPDVRLSRWLDDLLATPGLTALRSLGAARRELIEDSLTALPLLTGLPGGIADVGSGGGVPGIPLAASLPEREVVLIEASRRKCDFLERWPATFPNLRVICGRAEEQQPDRFGVVVAKALAPPRVALEWCLPLVEPCGAAILYTAGMRAGDLDRVAAALAGGVPELHPVAGSSSRQLVLVRKLGPTPAGFPRRPGRARKRPLL